MHQICNDFDTCHDSWHYSLELCLNDIVNCKIQAVHYIIDHGTLLVHLSLDTKLFKALIHKHYIARESIWRNTECDLRLHDWQILQHHIPNNAINDSIIFLSDPYKLLFINRTYCPQAKISLIGQYLSWCDTFQEYWRGFCSKSRVIIALRFFATPVETMLQIHKDTNADFALRGWEMMPLSRELIQRKIVFLSSRPGIARMKDFLTYLQEIIFSFGRHNLRILFLLYWRNNIILMRNNSWKRFPRPISG